MLFKHDTQTLEHVLQASAEEKLALLAHDLDMAIIAIRNATLGLEKEEQNTFENMPWEKDETVKLLAQTERKLRAVAYLAKHNSSLSLESKLDTVRYMMKSYQASVKIIADFLISTGNERLAEYGILLGQVYQYLAEIHRRTEPEKHSIL